MDYFNSNKYEREWKLYEDFLASAAVKLSSSGGQSRRTDLKLVDCVSYRVRFGHGLPPRSFIRVGPSILYTDKVRAQDRAAPEGETCSVPSGFDLLPNEVLCKIFGWLDTIDQLPLRRVCKRWEDVLRSRPCLETISICPQTLVAPPVPEECLVFALDKMVDKDRSRVLGLYGPRNQPVYINCLHSSSREEDVLDSIADEIMNYALGKQSAAEQANVYSVFTKGPLIRQFTVRCLHHSLFSDIRRIELTYGSVSFQNLSELPSTVNEILLRQMDLTGLASLTDYGEYGFAIDIERAAIVAWTEDERLVVLWRLAEQEVKPLTPKQLLRLANRIQLCQNFVLSDVLRGVDEIVLRREDELVTRKGPTKWDLATIKPLTAVDVNAFVRFRLDALGILGRH
ncbi:hypothetical protein RvY_03022 [Ramazzottius varieornatus]|uniref:F-box domain-containing protein n=1 Tax=Ramazzottius varieornatus TaxID=947166 RepID=A0A1D1UW63_RAMVA|nr:hypothetical protein RvY_03022 [Ramazzottius varieornatus]